MSAPRLSEMGREQVAIGLLLLKDWKCEGKFDTDITLMVLALANELGIRKEYDSMQSQIPSMRIEPR